MIFQRVGGGWWRGGLAVVLWALSAAHAGARVLPGADSAWARAVDAFLAGSEDSVPAILRLSPDEISRQSRDAFDAWTLTARRAGTSALAADAWRLAIRRVQAAALLPLEILSTLSTGPLRLPPQLQAHESAALEAWRRLGDEDLAGPTRTADAEERRGHRRFRAWWQVAHLQFLMNVGRLGDFRAQARQVRLAEDDRPLHGEFFLLCGMVEELLARVPPVPSGTSLTTNANGRQRFMTVGFGEAARWYRRAREAQPNHVEVTLHLGRVLLDLKRPDEAIGVLRPLVTNPCATTHCGLASLFIGEAHEMRHSLDESAKAYALASSRFDVRQSALIALMQLSVRGGTVTNGPPLIAQFVETMPLARRDGPDAWGTYLSGRRQNIQALLGPLREAMTP
jgi:hypothetical protein